jgi:aconitate hydratase
VEVVATADDGAQTRFGAIVRIDGDAEVEHFRHGGILQLVLRQMLAG